MAFVAISQRLREDVRNQIRYKQNQELALIPKPAMPLIQPDDPRVIERFWGEYAHLRDMVPKEWCAKVDNLQLTASYERIPGDPSSTDTMNVSVGIVGGVIKGAPKTDTYYPRMQVPSDAPEVAEHVAAAQRQIEVVTKWNKVGTDVMNFLTSCKSLNEALKLWPDVRIYIPQQYIDKAEEKTQKAKAAESRAMEVLKQIDTDHAVSSAVMVRILQANSQEVQQ
jgi:hypothetical protein